MPILNALNDIFFSLTKLVLLPLKHIRRDRYKRLPPLLLRGISRMGINLMSRSKGLTKSYVGRQDFNLWVDGVDLSNQRSSNSMRNTQKVVSNLVLGSSFKCRQIPCNILFCGVKLLVLKHIRDDEHEILCINMRKHLSLTKREKFLLI